MENSATMKPDEIEREIQRLRDATRAENDALKKFIEALSRDDSTRKPILPSDKPKKRKL